MDRTFLDDLYAGRAAPADVDDWVDRWHADPAGSDGPELHEFLGLTWPEYVRWVAGGDLPDPITRQEPMQLVVLQGGQVIRAHGPVRCAGGWGRSCPIHWPSQHHMRFWPQRWRDTLGIMERMCVHHIGHPDPDEVFVRVNPAKGNHDCCPEQCCAARIRAAVVPVVEGSR